MKRDGPKQAFALWSITLGKAAARFGWPAFPMRLIFPEWIAVPAGFGAILRDFTNLFGHLLTW